MFLHIKYFRYIFFFKKRKPYEQFKDAVIDLNVRVSLSIRVGFRCIKTKNAFRGQHKKMRGRMTSKA